MKRGTLFSAFLILLLICDFTFSFIQYYDTPLYGDIENCVLPDKHVKKVLEDPLGFKAISTGEKHLNPNRYFSHIMFFDFYNSVPFWLHKVTNPVSSLYLANAILKLIVQILYLYLFAFFISGKHNPFDKEFLYCAAIIAPLFQVYGYYSQMGVNDAAISYTFFYSVPLVLLMFFYIPVFRNIYFHKRIGIVYWLLLFLLTLILPLSGPLVAGVVLITSLLMGVDYLIKNPSIKSLNYNEIIKYFPPASLVLLFLISFWSLYSLYLGFYNLNYENDIIPVGERYLRLPKGIFSHVFHSFGLPLLIMAIGFNFYHIKKKFYTTGKGLISSLKWIGIFTVLYIILLPLGGYRPYRPLNIRYDSILPITIGLFYLFGASTFFLINQFTGKIKKNYILALVGLLILYTIVDTGGMKKNENERQAFTILANSTDSIVKLPPKFQVIAWEDIRDYKQSDSKAEFIYRWGITDKKKLYFNMPQIINSKKP